jgi:hypothetical protein
MRAFGMESRATISSGMMKSRLVRLATGLNLYKFIDVMAMLRQQSRHKFSVVAERSRQGIVRAVNFCPLSKQQLGFCHGRDLCKAGLRLLTKTLLTSSQTRDTVISVVKTSDTA